VALSLFSLLNGHECIHGGERTVKPNASSLDNKCQMSWDKGQWASRWFWQVNQTDKEDSWLTKMGEHDILLHFSQCFVLDRQWGPCHIKRDIWREFWHVALPFWLSELCSLKQLANPSCWLRESINHKMQKLIAHSTALCEGWTVKTHDKSRFACLGLGELRHRIGSCAAVLPV